MPLRSLLFTLMILSAQSAQAQNCDECGREWAKNVTPEEIHRLFETGVSPNGDGAFGNPLLAWVASQNPDVLVAQAFFDAAERQGIQLRLRDGDAPNYYGDTVLHDATRNDTSAMIKFLLANGADPNWTDDSNDTPLSQAPGYAEDVDIFIALLEAGADPNWSDGNGWTALHAAARQSDNLDIFSVLVEYGADVSATSDNGLTPLQISKGRDSRKIYNHLITLGASE